MDIDRLRALSHELQAEAATREADADTEEQWNAVICLRDAARYVGSAAAWLTTHDYKYVITTKEGDA